MEIYLNMYYDLYKKRFNRIGNPALMLDPAFADDIV
jgi:hypothetical protein